MPMSLNWIVHYRLPHRIILMFISSYCYIEKALPYNYINGILLKVALNTITPRYNICQLSSVQISLHKLKLNNSNVSYFQDVEGDTALHDAIAKCHDKAVDLLLSHPTINLRLTNNKEFNPLLFAALKDNN